MSIDPLKRGPVSPDEVARQAGAHEVRRDVAPKVRRDDAAPQDRVEVSAEALELAARPVDGQAHSLPLERVHEILSRLASGWYDRPEVAAAVAAKVTAEILGPVEE